jgi:protoporphyrin/coproporphyrin ferrochelatase
MSERAVLLVNLGSPASPSVPDVRRYLDEFLMDPRVIDMPWPMRAALVRGSILRSRPAKSAEAYAKIWTDEGSPLIVISKRQRAALEARLGIPVALAMRYGKPTIKYGLSEIRQRCGTVDELVVVPLYPHYAMASTQTVEVAVKAALADSHGAGPAWYGSVRFVPPFYDDPGYLDALAGSIGRHIAKDTQFVLFSYHGIPKRHLKKVDPTHGHCLGTSNCCETPSIAHATCYRHQVLETTQKVAERLGMAPNTYGFSFQSRLGGGWLEPYTDIELLELPKRGVYSLIVVCPAFVADCLETLEEIAIRGKADFQGAGGSNFVYVPCLNDEPVWIDALARLCVTPAEVPA